MSTNGNGNGWKAYLLAALTGLVGFAASELWRGSGENVIRVEGDVRGVARDLSDLRSRTSALEATSDDVRRRLDRIEQKLDALLSESR